MMCHFKIEQHWILINHRMACTVKKWIILGTFVFPILAVAQEFAETCDCPKLECSKCEDQTALTFYSEKCGKNGMGRRSCSRPTCQRKKDPIPPGCEGGKNQNSSASEESQSKENVASETPSRGPSIGKVTWDKGESWIIEPSGTQRLVRRGEEVHVRDKVKTGNEGEIKIQFQDTNELHIQPRSEVLMVEYESDAKMDRRALLNLIQGKVRSKVKQKYRGDASSFYQVRTKSAVAGVRGTDFVVSFDVGDRQVTKVETLTGSVALANADQSETVEVSKGAYASYVVEPNSTGVFSEEEISEFVARGYMTPLHHMSSEELEKLDWESEVGDKPKRNVASAPQQGQKKSVCQAPQGDINQCYWTCQNNPPGEARCRTDLSQVSCVRRRCNANGLWADETRLPASFHDQCNSSGMRVDACDY